MKPEFAWETVNGCPLELPLFRLASGDTRGIASRIFAARTSRRTAASAWGCWRSSSARYRARRVGLSAAFLECGTIGQVLYLEAEAAGLRGTGIGCFFDDGMHSLLGLKDRRYQSLYHFTVGGPLEDERLTTLPAYA